MIKKSMFIFGLLSSFIFANDIRISDAFAFESPTNSKHGAVFLKIENVGDKDINLIKASSNISDNVELHTHSDENGVIRMVKVDKMTIKAKSSLELKPKHEHIMLLNLKKPITKSTKIQLQLAFDNKSIVTVRNIAIKSR